MRRTAFASKAGIVGVWHQLNMGSQEQWRSCRARHEAARSWNPNFQGRYSFALSESVARGGLRPLRDPSEQDE